MGEGGDSGTSHLQMCPRPPIDRSLWPRSDSSSQMIIVLAREEQPVLFQGDGGPRVTPPSPHPPRIPAHTAAVSIYQLYASVVRGCSLFQCVFTFKQMWMLDSSERRRSELQLRDGR